MSEVAAEPRREKKDKKLIAFRRACRYLGPYRKIVTISVISAFFVGLIFTTGLGAMLPILKVLVNEDTVQGWVDRQITEKRVGVKLAEDPTVVSIVSVAKDKVGASAGLKSGDVIVDVNRDHDPNDLDVREEARERLFNLATSDHPTVTLNDGRELKLDLDPVPFHLRAAHEAVSHLPLHPVKVIAVVFGIIAALALLGNAVRFFQEYLSDKAAISATQDIRRHLYDHTLHIPMTFFGLKGTSDVTSRLVQDSQVLQDGFKIILGQSIQEPIKAAFAFGLALWVSPMLTLFIVVFAPVMAAVIKKFGKKMRRASRAMMQRSSTMLGQIEGTLIGIRVVKAAGAERFERRRYTKIMNGLKDEQLKMARYEAWATPAMETISLLVVGAVLMVASYLVLVRKTLDSSSFFLIMACLVSIGESLRRVSKLNSVLQRSNTAAARIFETLDVPVERRRGRVVQMRGSSGNGDVTDESLKTPAYGERNLPPIQREIRFDHTTFSYANATQPAVDDLSLVVPKGKSIAVVGRNGSGKTTLLALLPRFYDPQAGRISIDGVDTRTVTLRSLRKQIGIVTQDPIIFPGTIAENIAYGHPLAPRLHKDDRSEPVRKLREQIEAAAKRAFAHDFIMEKSHGYDTVLGELGGQLSGGQKQRINIARAILRSSPILILDEATSQVDAESEHLIQQAIESLMHERTTFVIAHRFSTILSADTIVVMDRGRIVGQGQHDELLANCPTYRQLYERQLLTAPA
jgi:ABC-type multidrug transport system fused ATPase/permease subunit